MIIRQRRDHADADEQNRRDQDRNGPVQDLRECVELQVLRHGHAPLPLAGIWTALGSFSSPARRVKDVE